jgi:hypothetical protein
MSEFQEAIEKAKAENPAVTLQEFVGGIAEALPAPPSLPSSCEAVMVAIDSEIGSMRQRINDLNRLAADMDRHIYPSDPIMAYGPIPKEEKWIYDLVDSLVRNEERNIEILERAKSTVKEKCK